MYHSADIAAFFLSFGERQATVRIINYGFSIWLLLLKAGRMQEVLKTLFVFSIVSCNLSVINFKTK